MTISVTTAINAHVGEIRFAKPPHNFACPELLRQIADAIDAFDRNVEVRCILLHSEGKSFCAGADLAGNEAITTGSGMDSIARLYDQAYRILSRQKPMIAAIQGAAIGAGLGLALSADFRIAAPAARFSANFTRLGFHPGFALTQTLPRVVGPQHAAWMMLSSERTKPDDALAWGLVDRLAGQDSLLVEARAMAAELAANAPLALVAVRKTLVADFAETAKAAMRHEHEQQSILKRTTDYEEGVASVFERREARFTGQ